MNLKIIIDPNTQTVENNCKICFGTIYIGDDFAETITPALDYWTVEDYKKQWQKGLEQIKTYDKSCLVASIQNPDIAPYLNWWVLYKENKTIYIYNQQFIGNDVKKLLKNKNFTVSSCYDFIQPKEIITPDDGYNYSEWKIDL